MFKSPAGEISTMVGDKEVNRSPPITAHNFTEIVAVPVRLPDLPDPLP